jgi:hypothetical protein
VSLPRPAHEASGGIVKLAPNEWAWLFMSVPVPDVRDMTLDEVITAVAIVYAESGGDTDIIAFSPTTSKYYGNSDLGGAQISNWWNGDRLQTFRFRDPYDTVRMFKLIWKAARYTFEPWNVTDTGAEQKWKPQAEVGIRSPFKPVNPNTTAWRA